MKVEIIIQYGVSRLSKILRRLNVFIEIRSMKCVSVKVMYENITYDKT